MIHMTIYTVNSEVLVYSTGNYGPHSVITYSGKESENEYIYTAIHCYFVYKLNIKIFRKFIKL